MNSNEVKSKVVASRGASNVPKLWTRPFILTLISLFVVSITMTFMMPLLPIYIKAIGGDISYAGLIVSVFTFAALIFRPIFAILLERHGRKPILIIGTLFILAGCFSYRYASVIGILFLIRVVHGIGYSASTNATGTIAADVLPMERRSQGIGYYGFVAAASLALGPAIGLMVMKGTDIRTAFSFAAALAAVGLVSGCLISYEKKMPVKPFPAAGTLPVAKSASLVGYEKSALPASLVMLLVAFANSGIVTFLPTYAGILGIHNISLFFIVYTVVLLATRISVDRLTRNRDISVVLLPGIVMMTVAFVILGIGKTLPAFLAAAVCYGIGYGSVQPTLNAIVISLCAPQRRGAANSTFFSSLDLGIGLGALVWGVFSQSFGYPAIYLGCLAFMAAAALSVFLFFRKK